MKGKRALFLACFVWLSLVASNLVFAVPPVPNKMTKEELLPLLGKADVTIIDLRFGREWYDSNAKIKSAVREDPMKPGLWMERYPKDKMLVLYCA